MISRGTTITFDVSLNGKRLIQGNSDFKNRNPASEQMQSLPL